VRWREKWFGKGDEDEDADEWWCEWDEWDEGTSNIVLFERKSSEGEWVERSWDDWWWLDGIWMREASSSVKSMLESF
jgi:hypothetical protein